MSDTTTTRPTVADLEARVQATKARLAELEKSLPEAYAAGLDDSAILDEMARLKASFPALVAALIQVEAAEFEDAQAAHAALVQAVRAQAAENRRSVLASLAKVPDALRKVCPDVKPRILDDSARAIVASVEEYVARIVSTQEAADLARLPPAPTRPPKRSPVDGHVETDAERAQREFEELRRRR